MCTTNGFVGLGVGNVIASRPDVCESENLFKEPQASNQKISEKKIGAFTCHLSSYLDGYWSDKLNTHNSAPGG